MIEPERDQLEAAEKAVTQLAWRSTPDLGLTALLPRVLSPVWSSQVGVAHAPPYTMGGS